MQKRHLNRYDYFIECANTSRSYYINYIKNFVGLTKETKILEVGCGEAGNLLPFAELGCEVTGIDRAEGRISEAISFFEKSNQHGCFFHKDVFDMQLPQEADRYDVILVHDVIEHISQKERFVKHLKQFVKTDGVIFWAFPAWQMPFGGHQQICNSRFCSKMPYIHLLPTALYLSLLKQCGVNSGYISELADIKKCKVSIEMFEKLLSKNNFRWVDRTLWFINPHYEQKFHLKPRRLNRLICRVKHVRNFFSTSCFYVTKLA